MSDFILNEVPDIYPQDDENTRQAHETDPSQGRHQAQAMQPSESAEVAREQTSSHQGSRSDLRMLEYTPSHPATANLMQHSRPENQSSLNQQDISAAVYYASRQDRFPPYQQMYHGQRSNWSQGVPTSSHQQYPESYYSGQVQPASNQPHFRRTSTSAQGQPSASTTAPLPTIPQQATTASAGLSSHTHSRQSSQSKVIPPHTNHGHRPSSSSSQHSQSHVSTREPDGRRWSSRVEAPQDLEVPVQYPYPPPPLPQYYYHYQQQQQQHGNTRGPESSFSSGGPTSGPGPSSTLGSGPSPSQSNNSRDIEGLGIHTYPPSPRRNQVVVPERNPQRPPIHESRYSSEMPAGGWNDSVPSGYQVAGRHHYPPYPPHSQQHQSWPGPGNYANQPGPSPSSTMGGPLGPMGGAMPEWYGVSPAYPGPQARGVKIPEERPPGGWYWSVTTVHQHKRTESRSTQQRHKQDPGRNDNTVPVQLCEPPLSNIVPPNPAALAADPPPKNKKKSKYTSEQDKLILDLKHKGLGWSEIAKLAKCDKTLAARNRYQVLIGQQGGGTFLWSHPDIRKLQSYLDESEKAKWHYLAEELSRRRGRKFTLEMCHYKISEMFRDNPGQFGVLKSKDPRNGGVPLKREEYEPHFSVLPPEDSPPHGYQPPGGAPPPPPPPPPGASGATAV